MGDQSNQNRLLPVPASSSHHADRLHLLTRRGSTKIGGRQIPRSCRLLRVQQLHRRLVPQTGHDCALQHEVRVGVQPVQLVQLEGLQCQGEQDDAEP